MSERQIRQLPRDLAVRRAENIVKSGRDERIEVAAADGRRLERRPRHRERMHAILVLQLMRDEAAVLPAAAGDDHVIVAVGFSVPVAQLDQLSFARIPIDVLALVLRESAGGADAVFIESDARTLVGDRAFLAEPDLLAAACTDLLHLAFFI